LSPLNIENGTRSKKQEARKQNKNQEVRSKKAKQSKQARTKTEPILIAL